jgi:hypothetical protein
MKCSAAIAMLLVALALAGCGASRNTSPAKGQVKVGGNPAANLTVTFYPEKGRPATGTTDAQGNFVLSTFCANDGAVVGPHKVAVTKNDSTGTPPMPGMAGAETAAPPPPFDPKYQNPQSSGLTAVVEKGGKNDFPFDLK